MVCQAPLLISGTVLKMTNYTLETYLNLDVIKVNQDALGAAGERIVGTDLAHCVGGTASCTNVWSKRLGSYPDGQPAAAMVFLNVGGSTADVRCDTACWAKAGFDGTAARRHKALAPRRVVPMQSFGPPVRPHARTDVFFSLHAHRRVLLAVTACCSRFVSRVRD